MPVQTSFNYEASKTTLGTPRITTSGAFIDFTGIPVGTKKITVMLSGVSSTGTSNLIVQLGDSGGIETTGYIGALTIAINTSANIILTGSNGILISGSVAGDDVSGCLSLCLMDSTNNTWVCSGTSYRRVSNNYINTISAIKSTSAPLDTIRITAANGTDTFDAGIINIQYE